MKKVFITMAIAALCFCSCGNNAGNKQTKGEETKVEECCENKDEGECCGKCAEKALEEAGEAVEEAAEAVEEAVKTVVE